MSIAALSFAFSDSQLLAAACPPRFVLKLLHSHSLALLLALFEFVWKIVSCVNIGYGVEFELLYDDSSGYMSAWN